MAFTRSPFFTDGMSERETSGECYYLPYKIKVYHLFGTGFSLGFFSLSICIVLLG
jgi:hypothetical protein